MAKQYITSFWTAQSLALGNSTHCLEIEIMLDIMSGKPSSVLDDRVVQISGVWDELLKGTVTKDGSKIYSELVEG